MNHAVSAAAARAHHQALQISADDWDRLEERFIDPSQIVEVVIPRWLRAVELWASGPKRDWLFMPPPRFDEAMTETEIKALEAIDDEPPEERSMIRSPPIAAASPQAAPLMPSFLSVGELVDAYPELRQPVIEGLLREGETMNVIASP